MRSLQPYDVVALDEDRPADNLVRWQVGTVVESLGNDFFEVEFSDDAGKPYAMLALPASQLLMLYHAPVHTS
jgi:hypothetical protein